MTLAMRVKVLAVRSSGYSCIRSKSDGDMTAGHRKRRNSEALIRRSLMSGRPRLPHSCRHDANTSLSSRGKTLIGRKINKFRAAMINWRLVGQIRPKKKNSPIWSTAGFQNKRQITVLNKNVNLILFYLSVRPPWGLSRKLPTLQQI